jgi:hypothetical protein
MPDRPTAYNPNDPNQSRFLSALALGESGSKGSPTVGFGGVDLSGSATDAYGFPQWAGSITPYGPTHAAGTYQFQPGTWDGIAEQYGLNFANPADQNAGAWYLAQQTYAQKTGGNLEDAIANGDYGGIASALGGQWQSLRTDPHQFIDAITSGTGAAIPSGATSTTASGYIGGGLNPMNWPAYIEDWFLRGGLIIVGGLVIIVTLYVLMERQGWVPSPEEIGKSVAAA